MSTSTVDGDVLFFNCNVEFEMDQGNAHGLAEGLLYKHKNRICFAATVEFVRLYNLHGGGHHNQHTAPLISHLWRHGQHSVAHLQHRHQAQAERV